MTKVNMYCKAFEELTLEELYEILALRQEVFIVEQNCPFLDADGKDQQAKHCLAKNEAGKLLAYTRIFDKNIYYQNFAAIGRVVSSPKFRGEKFGRKIFQFSIDNVNQEFDYPPIKIGAQAYLEKFYASFGFLATGEDYLEDGIPHKIMIRN
jgi:ElaA protein